MGARRPVSSQGRIVAVESGVVLERLQGSEWSPRARVVLVKQELLGGAADSSHYRLNRRTVDGDEKEKASERAKRRLARMGQNECLDKKSHQHGVVVEREKADKTRRTAAVNKRTLDDQRVCSGRRPQKEAGGVAAGVPAILSLVALLFWYGARQYWTFGTYELVCTVPRTIRGTIGAGNGQLAQHARLEKACNSLGRQVAICHAACRSAPNGGGARLCQSF